MLIKVERQSQDGYYGYDQFVGFTKLDEIEWDNNSYEFNITGIWVKDDDGTVWTADDSGCSCPTPWENTDTLERLFSIEPLEERYKRQIVDEYQRGSVDPDEWTRFKANVEAAFEALSKR